MCVHARQWHAHTSALIWITCVFSSDQTGSAVSTLEAHLNGLICTPRSTSLSRFESGFEEMAGSL